MMFLNWLLPEDKPNRPGKVIVEFLDGCYAVDKVGDNFESWSEAVIKWAYIDRKDDYEKS